MKAQLKLIDGKEANPFTDFVSDETDIQGTCARIFILNKSVAHDEEFDIFIIKRRKL